MLTRIAFLVALLATGVLAGEARGESGAPIDPDAPTTPHPKPYNPSEPPPPPVKLRRDQSSKTAKPEPIPTKTKETRDDVNVQRDITTSQGDPRRLIFAQICEDDRPENYNECAILEGKPFKYFLQSLIGVSHDKLRKQTNEQATFEKLMAEPGMHRGQVITLNRGVVIEVPDQPAQPTPDYGLPEGYTILPVTFVDSAHDVYALRILCPPGSKVFEKLKKGSDNDAFPVIRITGYFMKLYARMTNDPKEPPWKRPLLICPEPEFSRAAEPRSLKKDFVDNKVDQLLPSHRIEEAIGAEERMVVELLPGGRIRVDGETPKGDMKAFLMARARTFKPRLKPEQAENPAAVILIASADARAGLEDVLAGLRAAGVQRLAIKSEQ